jgi:hypothetical protein
MIAPYWTDLQLGTGGKIFTQYVDGTKINPINTAASGNSGTGSCK